MRHDTKTDTCYWSRWANIGKRAKEASLATEAATYIQEPECPSWSSGRAGKSDRKARWTCRPHRTHFDPFQSKRERGKVECVGKIQVKDNRQSNHQLKHSLPLSPLWHVKESRVSIQAHLSAWLFRLSLPSHQEVSSLSELCLSFYASFSLPLSYSQLLSQQLQLSLSSLPLLIFPQAARDKQ